MALCAHEFAIGFAEDGDLAGEAAKTHILNFNRSLVGGFRIKCRVVGTSHGLDQCVANDTGLSTVRVMAHVTVQSMVDVVNQIDRVGSTAPLGLSVRVAQVGPIHHDVCRFAGPANRVGCGCSTGFMRLLSVAGDRVIDLFPDAEETAVVTAEEPAFFRLEAAAEGAVGNKLVDCCISVRSRQVVFFHKAVSSECFIKEGIRRDVVQILLGIASDTMIVNLVHRFELIRVAAAALLWTHGNRRMSLRIL